MLNATAWKQIVSGRRRGMAAAAVRCLLWLGELGYRVAVRWRNRRFDRGKAAVHGAAVPVVSVGNLTVGGTGKTPLVAWLARWLRRRGIRVTLVSRGYGAQHGAVNDEALELELQLPDVPHLQNPDRVEAARVAVEELASQCILLDDGFQHRRLGRDLDIVLLDALEPFGYGHLLPRGALRESPAQLGRADVVALSRADQVAAADRERIWEQVARYAPHATRIELAHRPRYFLAADGSELPLADLAGRPVAAFCGIGNPDGFRRTLLDCGCQLSAWRELPDHFPYERADVEALAEWADSLDDCQAVLCTRKDLVKLRAAKLGSRPLRALAIEIDVISGLEDFETRLAQLAERAAAVPDAAD